jgi:Uma2 family endonuclease
MSWSRGSYDPWPSDTLEEAEEKVDEYLGAGTQMVLAANPKRRTITVHRRGANPVVLRDDEILDASPVLSDLKFAVRGAFAWTLAGDIHPR